MEKLLLERLLVRKELRLTAMQEKVLMQSISQTFNQSINCPIDDVINLSRWRVEMQGILVECIFIFLQVEMQGTRLREVESRLALLETIPGFFLFQWLGLLLLRLMVVLRKACRVNYLLLVLCKLNRLLLLPFSIYFENPKNPKIAGAEEEKDTKSLVPVKEDFPQANRRVNPRNRGLGL